MPAQPAAAKPSLTLKRRFDAPPHLLYAAWTNPAQIMKWFGPEGGTMTHAEADVRTGGRYAMEFYTEDGEDHHVSGVYREVVPNEKLVFTWMWRTMPERQSLVNVFIKPDGNGTLLTLIHEQFLDEPARDRHLSGWTGTLEKLAKHLNQMQMQ